MAGIARRLSVWCWWRFPSVLSRSVWWAMRLCWASSTARPAATLLRVTSSRRRRWSSHCCRCTRRSKSTGGRPPWRKRSHSEKIARRCTVPHCCRCLLQSCSRWPTSTTSSTSAIVLHASSFWCSTWHCSCSNCCFTLCCCTPSRRRWTMRTPRACCACTTILSYTRRCTCTARLAWRWCWASVCSSSISRTCGRGTCGSYMPLASSSLSSVSTERASFPSLLATSSLLPTQMPTSSCMSSPSDDQKSFIHPVYHHHHRHSHFPPPPPPPPLHHHHPFNSFHFPPYFLPMSPPALPPTLGPFLASQSGSGGSGRLTPSSYSSSSFSSMPSLSPYAQPHPSPQTFYPWIVPHMVIPQSPHFLPHGSGPAPPPSPLPSPLPLPLHLIASNSRMACQHSMPFISSSKVGVIDTTETSLCNQVDVLESTGSTFIFIFRLFLMFLLFIM